MCLTCSGSVHGACGPAPSAGSTKEGRKGLGRVRRQESPSPDNGLPFDRPDNAQARPEGEVEFVGRQDWDEWAEGRGLRRTQGCASAAGRVARTPQSRHAARRLALPPPATAARASFATKRGCRALGPHAARHHERQRRLSLTSLRCLVPESTAL